MKLAKNGSISIRVQSSGDKLKPFAFCVFDDEKFESLTYLTKTEYDEILAYLISKSHITKES